MSLKKFPLPQMSLLLPKSIHNPVSRFKEKEGLLSSLNGLLLISSSPRRRTFWNWSIYGSSSSLKLISNLYSSVTLPLLSCYCCNRLITSLCSKQLSPSLCVVVTTLARCQGNSPTLRTYARFCVLNRSLQS